MVAPRPVLHLIDGSGYIFRAYYAIRPLSTRAGVPTNAVVGFIRMLVKLLREEKPSLLGIAFDTGKPNFRHAILPTYKANREVPPEDLGPQFPLIFALVEAMSIPLLKGDGYEADDILASLSRQAIAAGFDVVLVSADKDLMQLVSPHLRMFDPLKEKHFDRAAVIEKFGVPPERIADLLALAGDTSDNIPGVPKVGPKSAAKLLNDFGDLDAVFVGLRAQAKRRAYEENVLQHEATVRVCRRLTGLDAEAPFALQPDALRYDAPERERLEPFLRSIDAVSILRDFGFGSDPTPQTAAQVTHAPPPPPHAATASSEGAAAAPPIDAAAYVTILAVDQLEALMQLAESVGRLSVDLETTSLEPARADIVGVALAVPGHPAAYVPVAHRYLGAPQQLDVATVLRLVRPVLETPKVQKVGQHLKYDWVVLKRAGVHMRNLAHDAMLAAYVLDPARASYGLDALAREFLGHQNISYNSLTGTGKKRISFEHVPVESAAVYAAEDADVALKLCEHLVPQVQASGLQQLYETIEMPLVPVLADMELQGVLIDSAHLQGLAKEFNARLIDIENEAYAHIGAPINLGSPKQLAYLFFEKLGYPVVKKTKTGYSTDQEVLETLARSYDIPRIILQHRQLSKLKSTYVDALPKLVHGSSGRVHTSFNQTGTATGRLSSSDPNLQNIPIRSEDGRRIRAAFIAPQGWDIISADYSQVELRIMAHLSQDEMFLEAFARGEDIHRRTAKEILTAGAEPSAEMRRRAKAINFGILYGLSEFGLARQLGIPRAEAHAYIAAYFARYPSIRHFLEETIAVGRKRGYVSTMTGRRRYLPNLSSKNGNVRQGAERIAMNTPIQGSAADLIKLAMIEVHKQLGKQKLRARLLLQVHDELVLEAPHDECDQVSELLRHEMAAVMQLRVPIIVDVGRGPNWAEAH